MPQYPIRIGDEVWVKSGFDNYCYPTERPSSPPILILNGPDSMGQFVGVTEHDPAFGDFDETDTDIEFVLVEEDQVVDWEFNQLHSMLRTVWPTNGFERDYDIDLEDPADLYWIFQCSCGFEVIHSEEEDHIGKGLDSLSQDHWDSEWAKWTDPTNPRNWRERDGFH